jgi:hypothetical protein
MALPSLRLKLSDRKASCICVHAKINRTKGTRIGVLECREAGESNKINHVPSKPLTLNLMETLGLFSDGLVIIKTRPTEILICKVGSVHFWHRIHPKKLRILQEMVQKLEDFTVPPFL